MKQLCTKSFRLPAVFAPVLVGACAAMTLLLAPSCTDVETDPPYVAVTSGSFTFSENTAANTVSIESNTDWEVCWTPDVAGVVVSPASGSGNATVIVEDMPKGISIQLAVSHGSDANKITSNSVSIARGSDGAGLYLTLDPSQELTYSAADPAANVIKVTTNPAAVWTAVPSNSGLKISPSTGTGSGSITVTDMTAGQSYTLTVTIGEGEGKLERTVTVTRPDPSQEVKLLYYNNFDKEKATQTYGDDGAGTGTYWPFLSQSDCWKNATGTGASATYTYSTSGVSARYNSFSSGYTGASGSNNLFMGAPSAGGLYLGRFFEIRGIPVPEGTNPSGYELSFGTRNAAGILSVFISGDGSRWVRVPVTIAADGSAWKLTSTKFALSKPVSTISLMFEAAVAPSSYGTRIDDVKLTTTTAAPGEQIDITTVPTNRWPELPAASSKPNLKVFTNFSTTVVTGQKVRNYTVGYDTDLHCPLWVASPQHYCYEEGGLTRPTDDPWAQDPNMTVEEQSIVVNPYSWVTSSYLGGGPVRWGRGHMLASSYRGCGDAANPAELNRQTFYMGNIAPQGGKAFDILWSIAENNILNKCVCADTLYCVSGAWFQNKDVMAKDMSQINAGTVASDPEAKECGVPTNFYKVLLRTKDGNTGKAIQDCQPSELQAVAFWFTRADKDPVSGSENPTQVTEAYLMSVKALSDKVGFEFFPEVDESVRAAEPVAADWGLPYEPVSIE